MSAGFLWSRLVGLCFCMVFVYSTIGLSQSPVINNFVHPPNTVTAPLGKLGHVERSGSGQQALILLPGAPFGWEVWEGFMRRNSADYTMYAVTLPGYAGTPPPPMPADPEDFVNRVWSDAVVDALLELIESEGMDRPVVVTNHLLSDYYGLRLALDHGDKIGGVVVSSGTPGPPPPASISGDYPTPEEQQQWVSSVMVPFYRTVNRQTWNMNTFQPQSFTLDEQKGREWFQQQLRNPISSQLRYFLEFQTSTFTSRLDELRVPLLVVQPTRNTETPIQAALSAGAPSEQVEEYIQRKYGGREKFAETIRIPPQWEAQRYRIPGLDIRYVDDSRLFVMQDRPTEFDRLLAAFVKSLPPKEDPLPSIDLVRGLAVIDSGRGRVEIDYGSPLLSGRDPLKLLPPGQTWRLGMNASTTLITEPVLHFGAQRLEPGNYVLSLHRSENDWQLQVTGSNGKIVMSLPLHLSEGEESIESLTLALEPLTGDEWAFVVRWGTFVASTELRLGSP